MNTSSQSIYFSMSELIQRIDSDKGRFLVLVGKNIRFSLSSPVHSFIHSYKGIKELTYLIYDTSLDSKNPSWSFSSSWNILLKKEKVLGLNITTPYKLEHYPSNVSLTFDLELDSKINSSSQSSFPILKDTEFHSINTLFKSQDKIHATSTDMLGLDFSLKKQGYSDGIKSFDSIVVLGSGGMSRALLDFYQLIHGRSKIFFLSRRSQDLLNVCKLDFPRVDTSFFSLTDESLKQVIDLCSGGKTLIINTLLKNVDTSWSFGVFKDLDSKQTRSFCFMDLNYDKSEGSVVQIEKEFFKKIDIDFIDGTDMLIAQAVFAESLWNNLALDYSQILDIVTKVNSKLKEL